MQIVGLIIHISRSIARYNNKNDIVVFDYIPFSSYSVLYVTVSMPFMSNCINVDKRGVFFFFL